jgi:hypothetical protein
VGARDDDLERHGTLERLVRGLVQLAHAAPPQQFAAFAAGSDLLFSSEPALEKGPSRLLVPTLRVSTHVRPLRGTARSVRGLPNARDAERPDVGAHAPRGHRQLEAALNEEARRRGVAPETLALEVLRAQFLSNRPVVEPQDNWERRLFGAAIDCGVSVPDSALSSDGLYE